VEEDVRRVITPRSVAVVVGLVVLFGAALVVGVRDAGDAPLEQRVERGGPDPPL
jgi:hypothetical protein